jgi:hypothetical protein
MRSSLAVLAIYNFCFSMPSGSTASGVSIGCASPAHYTVEPSSEGPFSPLNLGQPENQSRRSGAGIGQAPAGFFLDDLFNDSEEGESDPTESCGLGLMPVIGWDVNAPSSLVALPFLSEIAADSRARSVLRC